VDTITHQQIRDLSEQQQEYSVSLFMPTHRTGREIQQGPIRLKNLLREAEQQLVKQGASEEQAQQILAELTPLSADPDYWEHRLDGLAAFCSPENSQVFRVPLSLEELVHVGSRFLIKPLLPLVSRNKKLLVLALSQDSARLYETTQDHTDEIELPEIRKIEVDGDQQSLQFHTHAPGRASGSTDVAMYHGQGGPDDRAKVDILNFFQQVDKAVVDVLPDSETPLALACVEYLAPLYEQANSYKNLINATVAGSPDRLKLAELREHAWQQAKPHLQQREKDLLEKFHSASDAEHIASDIPAVTLAAVQGRVDTLFLKQNATQWGRVDAASSSVELADRADEETVDLLDFAAAETIRYGGNVYSMDDIPDCDSPVAALLRF
jgi:hypothetical protein